MGTWEKTKGHTGHCTIHCGLVPKYSNTPNDRLDRGLDLHLALTLPYIAVWKLGSNKPALLHLQYNGITSIQCPEEKARGKSMRTPNPTPTVCYYMHATLLQKYYPNTLNTCLQLLHLSVYSEMVWLSDGTGQWGDWGWC